MKDILINNPEIRRDTQFTDRLEYILKNKFKRSSLWIKGVEILTDIQYKMTDRPFTIRQKNISQAFLNYTIFLADYVNLVLFNNELAEERKSGPYNIFFSLTIDSRGSKAKVHIYLDSDIFGLIAGSRYINLINLIRASFPIFSKIGFEVELKLFSLQEETNKPRHNKYRNTSPKNKEEEEEEEPEADSFAEDDMGEADGTLLNIYEAEE